MFDTCSFLKCFPLLLIHSPHFSLVPFLRLFSLFAAYLLDYFFPVYHERREGSPPPPPDFERLLFNYNAYKPGGTLPKYISGIILISVTRKCAYVIPIVPASSRFSIWWPQKTKRPWGQATKANWVVARHWMRMRKNWHNPRCPLRCTCTYYFFYLEKIGTLEQLCHIIKSKIVKG